LKSRSELNDGSIVMMSGSGYVTGWAPGVKSRGGLEMTVGGLLRCGCAGVCCVCCVCGACALTTRGVNTATQAAVPNL